MITILIMISILVLIVIYESVIDLIKNKEYEYALFFIVVTICLILIDIIAIWG